MNSLVNRVGKVVTVQGLVPADSLGTTLMHEHIFVDLRKNHLPHLKLVNIDGRSEPIRTTEDFPATELALWESKLGLDNLHAAVELQPISDNFMLVDEEHAIEEVMEFKNLRGKTIVEVTSIGLKRDPQALRRVSEATGLNIVMGTGFYHKVFHPVDMDALSVEELMDQIVNDITVGIRDTGICAGIIGEIGINGDPITTNEIKSIRAAARASVTTGAPMSFHRGGRMGERHQSLDIVQEEEGLPNRVVLGHTDEIAGDLSLMLELLERGVYLEFDLIGRTTTAGTHNVLGPSITMVVCDAILQLIDNGYEDRILLSHDVCWKVHLKRFGGFGYSYIMEKFLPHLRGLGVTDSQIDKMMIQNPATVLPFVAPSK